MAPSIDVDPRPAAAAAERHFDHDRRLACLAALEKKALWLSAWMIHHANHVRPKRDGLKVGGHQASSASVSTILTALYLAALRPQDRVAVKPHASPMFHALQYLLGRQTREKLEAFRAFGGAQSYPSRTKDAGDVDFSTGSVGLGAAMTVFASLTQDYLRLKGMLPDDEAPARMVAIVGDAELDEGNIYECLLEGWKHDIRNCWWIIDYNRQSLDGVVADRLFHLIDRTFRAFNWNVVTLKYGRRLMAAFEQPGGKALRRWINACPNDVYSALTFQGGAAWRQRILADVGGEPGVPALLQGYDDDALHDLMTNLGGNDLETVLAAFESVADDRPTAFIAYTIKGFGLPLAGHKDNHAGILTPAQMQDFQRAMGVADGREWDRFAGLDVPAGELEAFLRAAPISRRATAAPAPDRVAVPTLAAPSAATLSTQEAFGRILNDVGRSGGTFAERLVSASPDVTVSTNLGPWVNQRGLFARAAHDDVFRQLKVVSAQKWTRGHAGQHIELGIAENNLFLCLAALGLSEPLFGRRLLPVGTLYDPFIARGLDALNYACYQDARFVLVATPSGISLGPEGGAHQSVGAPLIGIGQPGLTAFEPAFADELAVILHFGFEHLQADDGGSLYLRLSTRPVAQPERPVDNELARDIVAGGYWLRPPAAGAGLAIVYQGAVAPEAMAAYDRLAAAYPGLGLLAVTSADRLHRGWKAADEARRGGTLAESHIARLLTPLAPRARLVTAIDGHPTTLSWIGAVRGLPVAPLGVEDFGQCGDLVDLYGAYGLDTDAIVAAAREP